MALPPAVDGPFDRLAFGDEARSQRAGRGALWATALATALFVLARAADAPLRAPALGALVGAAFLLALWTAGRGAGLLAVLAVAGAPLWGYLAAFLLAPLVGVPPVPPLDAAAAVGLRAAPAVAAEMAAVPLLAGLLAFLFGRAGRRVTPTPTDAPDR